jgi:hypothetical protein
LPISQSTYYEHKTRENDPARRPERAKRDESLKGDNTPVWEENFRAYGAPWVWRQLNLSIRYTERLAETQINVSVDSVGDSYDNALAETINGLYKTEVIRRRGPWKNIEAIEHATLEWVDWFNNCRLLEPIGNMPPAEFEMNYYQQQEESAMVA